jgi:hypothetical protein
MVQATLTLPKPKPYKRIAGDPRGKLVAELKKYCAEFDSLTSKAHLMKARMFGHTYEWVRWTVENTDCTDVKDACVRLGNTIKRSYRNVESWFYCGKFMVDNKINPQTADARSIRAVWQNRRGLTKGETVKCIDKIRKGEPHRDVAQIVNTSPTVIVNRAKNRHRRMSSAGDMTRQRVKLELMALQTFAAKFFGHKVVVTLTNAKTGKQLMQVK